MARIHAMRLAHHEYICRAHLVLLNVKMYGYVLSGVMVAGYGLEQVLFVS